MVLKLENTDKVKKKKKINKRTKQLIFYLCLVVLPLVQFCIFYIYVNFSSIMMAFQEFDAETNKYVFAGLKNFEQIYLDWVNMPILKVALKNSIILYVVTLLCMVISTLFSYYIYKKRTFSGLFKIILFLPNIISGLILALIYMYFTERAVPEFVSSFGKTISGLLSDSKTSFVTIIIFNILMSFGTQTLLISGAMEGVSDSITDASQIDGCTPIQEFIHIIVPMIWPTITTFLVVGVAGVFTNQMSLYAFYGENAEYANMTIGYYLYRETLFAGVDRYPYLAALGLVLTVIVVPITYIMKWATNKFGPKTS